MWLIRAPDVALHFDIHGRESCYDCFGTRATKVEELCLPLELMI